jgi:hypothetical protein
MEKGIVLNWDTIGTMAGAERAKRSISVLEGVSSVTKGNGFLNKYIENMRVIAVMSCANANVSVSRKAM